MLLVPYLLYCIQDTIQNTIEIKILTNTFQLAVKSNMPPIHECASMVDTCLVVINFDKNISNILKNKQQIWHCLLMTFVTFGAGMFEHMNKTRSSSNMHTTPSKQQTLDFSNNFTKNILILPYLCCVHFTLLDRRCNDGFRW